MDKDYKKEFLLVVILIALAVIFTLIIWYHNEHNRYVPDITRLFFTIPIFAGIIPDSILNPSIEGDENDYGENEIEEDNEIDEYTIADLKYKERLENN